MSPEVFLMPEKPSGVYKMKKTLGGQASAPPQEVNQLYFAKWQPTLKTQKLKHSNKQNIYINLSLHAE